MADYSEVMEKLDYLDDTKVQIKNAIIEKGQEITNLDSFRDYVAKILNIDGGRVKLYNNEEEMYADSHARSGDLAVVYDTTYSNISKSSMFNEVSIPNIITLGMSALNTSYSMIIQSYSYTWYNRLLVSVTGTNGETPASLHITAYTSKSTLDLVYSSTDEEQQVFEFQYGTLNSEEIEFNTEYIDFQFEQSVYWSSGSEEVFGGVFKTRNIYFGGIYQYMLNQLQDNTIYYGTNPRLDENTFEARFDYVDWVDMSEIQDTVLELCNATYVAGICKIDFIKTVNGKKVLDVFDIYADTVYMTIHNNKLYIFKASYTTEESADNFIANNKGLKGHFDISNLTYNETEITYTKQAITIGGTTYYYVIVDEIGIDDNLTSWIYSESSGGSRSRIIIENPDLTNSITRQDINIMGLYLDKYFPAPTQLTAEDDSYIVTGKVAYGNNGIITGDGTYLKHTTTNEFRNFFMPQLPTTYDSTSEYNILQSGKQVPYYTFVDRKNISCTDIEDISNDDALVVKLETVTQGTYESELYNTIYNATYHRTFYCINDNKMYFGYFGYNMSDKQSQGSSGSTVHEEFRQIYGILMCVDDMTVYKTVSYTTTWRPFSGWGTSYEDPNANLSYLNYDFTNDEFIAIVDTGSWAWSGSDAPYLALLKINGTTGVATPYRWQIGRNGVPYTYAQVTSVRYDMTTKKLIIPMSSWNEGGSSSVDRVMKMDLSGNKSLWINNGYSLSGYTYLGGENSFYLFEPIYYYEYKDGNNVTHSILKRIDDDRQLEIPTPYSLTTNRRCIYNGYLYYFNSDKQLDDKYPIYRVDLNNMTYEKYGEIPSYTSTYFILYNGVPHLLYSNYMHSLDDIEEPIFIYYNSNQMYNDVRIDGVTMVDGNIQGEYPRAVTSSTGITFSKTKQIIYQFVYVADYKDITEDVYMVWPNAGNGKYSKQYMYQGLLIGNGVASILSPEEFIQAKQLVESMLGGTQVPSPEIEYINRCNELAESINGE